MLIIWLICKILFTKVKIRTRRKWKNQPLFQVNDKWSKRDIFRTPPWSLGHVAFLALNSSEYGSMSQRNLSWRVDSQGFMLRMFWYIVFERRHVFMRTTKQVIPFTNKTLIYRKNKWKKSVGIHQGVIQKGGSNQCRTQTYFRTAETVRAPKNWAHVF